MKVNTITIEGRIASKLEKTADGEREYFLLNAEVPGGVMTFKIRYVIDPKTPPLSMGDTVTIYNGQIYAPNKSDDQSAPKIGINVDPGRSKLMIIPVNKGEMSPEQL